jgi:CheY-like chemotaxis protein/DNA-directed RNA polymerase specialized sigma24 family protein
MNPKDIVHQTPYLRRYARALTGSQGEGDRFVRRALEALRADGDLLDPGLPAKTALFKLFHALWRRSLNGHSIDSPGHVADRRLMQLTPEHRTALLLVTMEGFSLRETSYILGLTPAATQERLEAAERAVERQLATNVLIVEDEPIVALDLGRILRGLGHTVVGVAATRADAQSIAEGERLGLILADLRLADGSSGLDVAADILEDFDIPVIFVTAFPERLLTGYTPEPAFLLAKPFQDVALRALIGQALFFHDPASQTGGAGVGTRVKLNS